MVISPATDSVRDVVVPGAGFAVQDEPRGTADAVRAALDVLPPDVAEIVVLSGDVPLVTAEHRDAPCWRRVASATRWSPS